MNCSYDIIIHKRAEMKLFDFIELKTFRDEWKKLGLNDEDLRDLQQELMKKPDGDAQIGHLSKIRFASNTGQGKSGGARVAFVYVKQKNLIFLVFCFAKNQQTNFTAEQKKLLKLRAKELVDEALSSNFMRREKINVRQR